MSVSTSDIFSYLTVQVDYQLRRVVCWGLKDSFVDRVGRFVVERSIQGAPFTTVSNDLDSLFLIIEGDTTLEPSRDARYRVIFRGVSQEYVSEEVQEGPVPGTKTDLQYAVAMYRRELMTLERYSGIPGQLVKKRRTGTLCSVCADYSVGASTRSNCPACLGTGLEGGYYSGVNYCLCLLGAPDTTKQIDTGIGTIEPGNQVKARGVRERWIERGDVWVSDSDGARYEILASAPEVVYKDLPITVTLLLRKLSQSPTGIGGNSFFTDKLIPKSPVSVDDIFN